MYGKAVRLTAFLVAFVMLVTIAGTPDGVYAGSKKTKAKAKVTYSVTVKNLDSNTVIKKGSRFRIKYKAVRKKKGKISRAKVGFRSSNTKIATVSSKGVIKAKKKGTVRITVYCKKKPSKKKTVKIRIGTPVKAIQMSGQEHLCAGRSTSFKATPNKSATNKKLKWQSDNAAVAAVSSKGRVLALSEGTATISAYAVDGSGVKGSLVVHVHEYSAADARWIAHRGFHTAETENTAAAFTAAGDEGFWGCECDIWETRHLTPDITLPPLPEDTGLKQKTEGNDDSSDPDGKSEGEDPPVTPDLTELKAAIDALPQPDSDVLLDRADDVKAAWKIYDDLSKDMTDEEKSKVRAALITKEEGTSVDLLKKLFDAYERVYEYESFDLVINHDSSYDRVSGVYANVWELTDEEVRAQMPQACFLGEFMKICREYGMIPSVEIKGTEGHYITDDGIRKMAEIIVDAGGKELLAKTYFISFDKDSLARARDHVKERYGVEPYTALLIKSDWEEKVSAAAENGFSAVGVTKKLLDDELYDRAKALGLGVGTWTYKNSLSDENLLNSHLQGRYVLDFVTLDYKVFR